MQAKSSLAVIIHALALACSAWKLRQKEVSNRSVSDASNQQLKKKQVDNSSGLSDIQPR